MVENLLEEKREDNTTFENELKDTIDLLERLPEDQRIDYSGGRQTQYLLDSEEHTVEDVREYFQNIEKNGILQVAGDQDRYHRLTVDNDRIEDYLD